jgi:hypothetical protein
MERIPMAPLTMHLVIGERVYPHRPQFNPSPSVYGAFLLGCILVDVHGFSEIRRPTTHFAHRSGGDDVNGFDRSCANFLEQLDTLLVRPWDKLTCAEQAFVAGYFCHLAADEDWKRFDWNALHTLGISLWRDLPVPGDVLLTTFDVLSNDLYVDFPSVSSALREATVPDVMMHVSHSSLQAMWDAVKAHVVDHSTLDSYLEMLRRLGKTGVEIREIRHKHEVYWEEAVKSVHEYFGGVQSRMEAMVRRSLEMMPRFWTSTDQRMVRG